MAKLKKTPNLLYRDGNPWMDWTHREAETGIAIRRYRESLNLVAGRIITEKEDAIAVMEKTKTLIREGRFRGTFAKSEKSDAEKKLITVGEVVTQYCETHIPTMAGTTDARSMLTRFSVYLGSRTLQSITTLDVERYLEGLKKPERLHPRHKTDRVRSVATVVTHFIRLRAFFNWARERGFVTLTPFRDAKSGKVLITKPKGQAPRPCPLTLAQQAQLIEAIGQDHAPALGWLIVALDTGLRHGEQFGRWNRRDGLTFDQASGVRVKDMNFFTGKLTVRKEIAKTGKQRTITVSTKRALAALKAACQPDGKPRHPDELIFADIDGRPLPYNAPAWRLKKAAQKCNITVDVFWHGLRHVFGKNALRAGIAAPFIQRQYGHATLAQTVDYLDIDDDGTSEAMKAMSGIVEPGDTSTTQEGEKVAQTA
jgi:integrase